MLPATGPPGIRRTRTVYARLARFGAIGAGPLALQLPLRAAELSWQAPGPRVTACDGRTPRGPAGQPGWAAGEAGAVRRRPFRLPAGAQLPRCARTRCGGHFPTWAPLAPHFGSLALAHRPAPTVALVGRQWRRASCPLLAATGSATAPHMRSAGSGGGGARNPNLEARFGHICSGTACSVGPVPFPACHPGASGPHGAHGPCAGGGAGILFSNGLMQILKTVLVRLRRRIVLRSACSARRAPVGELRSACSGRRAPVGVLRVGRCLSSSAGS
jgi:hypothetical protein